MRFKQNKNKKQIRKPNIDIHVQLIFILFNLKFPTVMLYRKTQQSRQITQGKVTENHFINTFQLLSFHPQKNNSATINRHTESSSGFYE